MLMEYWEDPKTDATAEHMSKSCSKVKNAANVGRLGKADKQYATKSARRETCASLSKAATLEAFG